ncbi:ABC transporter permease [Vibrio penaeicida]|uniref:ABC transporter permease n=1 Tax=Vibrio penaeicida TaxID=104609 RepID=UPI000CEA3A1D|nr:ABC transporter permease [Vibrio penaeicida]
MELMKKSQPNSNHSNGDSWLRSLLVGQWASLIVLAFFYAFILVTFSTLSPWFLSYDNLMSIGTNMAVVGLMAAAGTPLMIAGGLDLSVAAVAGLSGVTVSIVYESYGNIWLGCGVGLVLGAACGYVNGFFATRLQLNPLIVTLGTMSIFTGTALVMTGGLSKPLLDDAFQFIGNGQVASVPVPFILLVLVVAMIWFVLAKTRYGRYVYACGGNQEASYLAGVPVVGTQMLWYILSGLAGALAGIVLASMLGASAPDAAGQSLLTVVAAIILGGTSLKGGVGSVWGTLIAVLLLGTLNNGLTLMNVSSFWQDITRGAVLLLAVGVDAVRRKALA